MNGSLEDRPSLYMAHKPQKSQSQWENLLVNKLGETIDDNIFDAYDTHVVNNYYSQSNTSSIKFTIDDIPPSLLMSRF